MEALMTPNELRQYLNVSRSTLSRMLDAGLPHFGRGRLRRFELEEVLAFYDAADSEPASANKPGMQ